MNTNNQLLRIRLLTLLLVVSLLSCNKLLDIDPPKQSISAETIYGNNLTAASVLTGIYAEWGSSGLFTGVESIGLRTGLYVDELVSTAPENDLLTILYHNKITRQGNDLFWRPLYTYIYKANSAIEGLTESSNLSSNVKDQLMGEAKFVRALLYFYLVNLYDGVPLIVSTNLSENITSPRIDAQKLYQQIVNDLQEATKLLNAQYVASDVTTSSSDRVRPTKAAATALLARVYLYMKQWQDAEAQSSAIIENGLYSLESHWNTFLKTSREAIWQIQPTLQQANTLDARVYILYSIDGASAGPNGGSRPVYLSRDLYNSFESNDLRKTEWLDTVIVEGKSYPFAKKYKIWESGLARTEYIMMLRLAEQYLIRSEARCMEGKIGDALADLNVIRARSGLEAVKTTNKDSLLYLISEERRHELFIEGGHRYLDLKRSNILDKTMDTIAVKKGGNWLPYMRLFPLPIEDIKSNVNLRGHQNPGYPEF